MRAFLFLLLSTISLPILAQAEDVFISDFSSGYDEPIDITIDEAGFLYVVEKAGLIYRVDESGDKPSTPWLDISEEVTNWNDHGLMGICLDKNYSTNGYFYLLYVVDPYWEAFHDQPGYVADSTITLAPSWGRITRYQADVSADFEVDATASRQIILGATVEDGIPLHHKFHGLGKIVMADDGSLLISVGDGASNSTDIGDDEDNLAQEAIDAGILPASHHIGSYRSQYLGSLQGKILRVDAASGDGLSSNPFYDEGAPKAARSRVWAMGLRNPYRFNLLANSGSHDPADGQPGTLVIGDVGNSGWEELNLCTEGGQNFGWPLYEGNVRTWAFAQKPTPLNPLAINPAFGQGDCSQEYFDFRQTIRELRRFETGPPSNPCDPNQVVDYFGMTSITSPLLAWSNQRWNPPSRATTQGFDASDYPIAIDFNDPNSFVSGENFDGFSAFGGFFFDLPDWPGQYQGKLLFYDFSGWLKLLSLDEDLQPVSVEDFLAVSTIHTLIQDTERNRLLFLRLSPHVHQITYGGNPAPVAVPLADRHYGSGEINVNFNAYASYDPNDELADLNFRWSFPDGSSSNGPEAQYLFTAPDNNIWSYQVYLTATDPMGVSHTDSVLVSLNNSPPTIDISSFEDGDRYPVDRTNLLELRSTVTDAEHRPEELRYEWQVYLHHNAHYHPEAVDENPSSFLFLGPPGCDGEIYYYRVRHRVTDPEGLFTEVEQVLEPDCDPAISPDLSALSDPQGVDLSWTLPSDLGELRQLELQRSRNNFDFQVIQQLSTSELDFRDLEPIYGNNIYRIKVTSAEGTINYSNLAMASWPVPYQFSLSPNPSDGQIQLQYNDPITEGAFHFKLYDMSGRHLLQLRWFVDANELGFTKDLDISQLAAGAYWYTLEGEGVDISGRVLLR